MQKQFFAQAQLKNHQKPVTANETSNNNERQQEDALLVSKSVKRLLPAEECRNLNISLYVVDVGPILVVFVL